VARSGLSVEFVSHASVVIRAGETAIWTDPWLFGSAFNNSWELLGPTPKPPGDLEEIQYLWISHEHPDHFHIPTLRSLPESFKRRVTVLFQSTNSRKMFEAFQKMGYPNRQVLLSRLLLRLPGSDACVYCYPVGQMDSALGVAWAGASVLNVNDCELDAHDCRSIRREFGAPDLLLNQFSIAGYSGLPDAPARLDLLAAKVLHRMAETHRNVEASITIPIASFAYFSREDNAYVNGHANRPSDVVRYLGEQRLDTLVLGPGDMVTVGKEQDSARAITFWERAFDDVATRELAPSETTGIEEIEASFHARVIELRKKYPGAVLRVLRTLVVDVSDLGVCVAMNFAHGTFEVDSAPTTQGDVVMNSQPLWFMLSQPFGMQTLGVSGRYQLTTERSFGKWRQYRILFAMDNAEVYLRPSRLFNRANLDYVRARYESLPRQLAYQLRRMR
jgi:UDP-MurNAc hydroxylase